MLLKWLLAHDAGVHVSSFASSCEHSYPNKAPVLPLRPPDTRICSIRIPFRNRVICLDNQPSGISPAGLRFPPQLTGPASDYVNALKFDSREKPGCLHAYILSSIRSLKKSNCSFVTSQSPSFGFKYP